MSTKSASHMKGQNYSVTTRTFLTLFCCGLLTAGITYILFNYTQTLLKERLQERIIAIASTAAANVSSEDVDAVVTYDDLEKPQAVRLAASLKRVRDINKDVRFAYILRRTDDPAVLHFVMDAETLDSVEEQEARAGEDLAEDELAPGPGDELEISEYPALQHEAFYNPTAESELQTDQWSTQLSAYSPIVDAEGNTIAVLGVDVEITDYLARVRETLLPFLLFILFLISLLTFLTLLLIRFWGERVKILQELDRQKDELLGIVAHQLAKPITAIRWDLESLLDGDLGALNEKQKEEAALMKSQAVNLADLVSMILDVSRIQLGKIKLEPQPLDLDALFKEMLDVIHPQVVQKKLKFAKNMPQKLPTVLLDKRYTRMTLENMLTNAVKYTPEGGAVSLDVSARQGVMRVSVKDTGCGIPKSEQDKIFGKMYRATNVRNTVEGNGFGLYVAKGAIESQGGRMWFESEEGKGTTFHVELPLKEAK
jgi:signal transduction histidine kinase